jgi:hypothetical protein
MVHAEAVKVRHDGFSARNKKALVSEGFDDQLALGLFGCGGKI